MRPQFLLILSAVAFFGILPNSATAAGSISATKEPERPTVRFDGGLITVDVTDSRLGPLLSQIGQAAGIKVSLGEGLANKSVTVRFENLPLESGLKAILRGAGVVNHALEYRQSQERGKIGQWVVEKIYLKEKGTSTEAPSPTRVATQPRGKAGIEKEPFFDKKLDRFVDVVKGEVLIRFKKGLTEEDISKLLGQLGATVIRRNEKLGIYRLRIPDSRTVSEFLDQHGQNENLVVAEPNFIAATMAMLTPAPNDPLLPSQWAIQKIEADKAWQITTGSPDVVVAVIDTGIEMTHEDLRNKVLPGTDIVNDDPDPSDDHGHGTHVAGIIAAEANNSIGIAGISWNSQLLPIKVITASGEGAYSDVIEGIIYAADNEARVFNLSIGGYSYSQVLGDAVKYAHSNGAVLVAAAGNEDSSAPIYPAAYPNVIGVSATDSVDQVWPSSNQGAYIKLSAPGADILSTAPNGQYAKATGTSASTGHVSGVAALIFAKNRDFSNRQVEQILYQTADDLDDKGWDQNSGYGRLNAEAILVGVDPVTEDFDTADDSRSKDLGLRQTPNGNMTILYSEDTHVWIGHQAFQIVPGGVMRTEIGRYLGEPVNPDCSGFWNETGSTVLEGMWEEDCDNHYFRHFWDPDSDKGLPGLPGLPDYETAPNRAQTLFDQALAAYRSLDWANSYYLLGRVGHLLEDMAQPAHVHLDPHGPFDSPDNYESWVNAFDIDYTSLNSRVGMDPRTIAFLGYSPALRPIEYRSLPPDISGGIDYRDRGTSLLFRLFLNLAETADYFESEDSQGDSDNIQFDRIGSEVITWHDPFAAPPESDPEFSDFEVRAHADSLVPLAMRYVAGLFQLFWDTTHFALRSGVAIADSVTAGTWKFYSLDVPSGATQLIVEIYNAPQDVDIFVKFSQTPTFDTWDCRPYTPSGNETCTISNPSSGTWIVGVRGAASGLLNYALRATYTSPSPVSVTWVSPPPSVMVSGQSYLLSWTISGATSIQHGNVHWNPTDPADNILSVTCASAINCWAPLTGIAGTATGGTLTLTAPAVTSSTTILYAVHARVNSDGIDRLSTYVPVTINPPITDTTAPATSNLIASPNPTNGATFLTISSTVSDTASGNSNIAAAELFVDSPGASGFGFPMFASDGSFNTATEQVEAIYSMSAWVPGTVRTVYVHGKDAAGNWGAFQAVLVTVTGTSAAPTIVTNSPLPSGVVNTFYSETLQATGGSTAYSWSVVSGNLPPGLGSTGSTGVISGTPSIANTYSFRIRVTGSDGLFSEKDFSLTINSVPPTTRALTVDSVNPNSGVSIAVSPTDNNAQGGGTTSFARVYNADSLVTLTAPSTAGGNTFQKWQRNGVDYSVNPSISVTMAADYTLTAVYTTSVITRTLTVLSLNPSYGVAITLSPNDTSGNGSGITPMSRTYNSGASITLSAASGHTFVKWQRNGVDYSTALTVSLTMDADYTLTAIYAAAGTFVATDIPLSGISSGSASWGDYDNDGDLDVLLTGSGMSKIYRNNAGNFVDVNALLVGVGNSSASWGDYDNDGDLDIALTGNASTAKIYRNDNGNFIDISAPIAGGYAGSVAWGDYDNDGDLDLLVTGEAGSNNYISRVYRNNGGTFAATSAALTGVWHSSVGWGDYDNDGDLDILLAGATTSAGNEITKVYRNDGGAFVDVSAPALGGLMVDFAAWGDYDSDGDLDILGCGSGSRKSKIFRNDPGNFIDVLAPLAELDSCATAWGDYDNDGDLDILLTGQGERGSSISKVYRNDAGSFVEVSMGLSGVKGSSVAWGDYDNDGDLDILLTGTTDAGPVSKIYQNTVTTANSSPAVPADLNSSVTGNTVTLSWNKSIDGQTVQNGLTYNLRVGTSPGAAQTLSPMADVSTGYRRISKIGNTNHGNRWTLNGLSPGTYYWSVQAVDSAFAGSAFASEQTFTISSSTTPGVLLVSPEDGFSATGTGGGPFTPASKTYTLRNSGGSPIDVEISVGQPWLSVSSSGGSLLSGMETTVTAQFNSSVNTLAPSPTPYTDAITFTNLTNGIGSSMRPVTLTVIDGSVPIPDFTITPQQALMVIPHGGSAIQEYAFTPVNGFDSSVALELSSVPPGITWGAVVPPVNEAVVGSLTVSVASGVDCGLYDLTVTATSGSIAHAVSLALDVTGCGGLKAEYYDNVDLTDLKLMRTVSVIDFDWGPGSPASTMGSDNFSARWTGQLLVDHSETYTFGADTDDGVRLWIDGHLVIDYWQNGAASNNGTMMLAAGLHDIKVEFFEGTGEAFARLHWSSPSTPYAVIPQDHLTPAEPTGAAPVLGRIGDQNYESDGLHPAAGNTAAMFVYRVRYQDQDGDGPMAGYPRLHILKGGVEINGSPFSMTAEGAGDYATGRVFRLETTLESGSNYTYYFDAKDASGLQAVASPTHPTPTAPFHAPEVSEAPTFLGDIDGSGRIDGFDLGRLGVAFDTRPGDARWDSSVDLNADGVINGDDLTLLQGTFGAVR